MIIKYEISKETIKRTFGCTSGFRCLDGEPYLRCQIDRAIEDGPLNVKSSILLKCGYMLSWEHPEYICACPTRREIYERYGK